MCRRSFDAFPLVELEGRRIDAEPRAVRTRTVIEDVPQVRFAGGAQHLGAPHPERLVGCALDVPIVDGPREAGPAGARIVFVAGIEEGGPAARAAVHALAVMIGVLAGERRLRSLLARHVVLLRRQQRPPLAIGLGDLARHGSSIDWGCSKGQYVRWETVWHGR